MGKNNQNTRSVLPSEPVKVENENLRASVDTSGKAEVGIKVKEGAWTFQDSVTKPFNDSHTRETRVDYNLTDKQGVSLTHKKEPNGVNTTAVDLKGMQIGGATVNLQASQVNNGTNTFSLGSEYGATNMSLTAKKAPYAPIEHSLGVNYKIADDSKVGLGYEKIEGKASKTIIKAEGLAIGDKAKLDGNISKPSDGATSYGFNFKTRTNPNTTVTLGYSREEEKHSASIGVTHSLGKNSSLNIDAERSNDGNKSVALKYVYTFGGGKKEVQSIFPKPPTYDYVPNFSSYGSMPQNKMGWRDFASIGERSGVSPVIPATPTGGSESLVPKELADSSVKPLSGGDQIPTTSAASTKLASDSTSPTTAAPKAPIDHMAMWGEVLQNPAHQAGVQSNQQGRAI